MIRSTVEYFELEYRNVFAFLEKKVILFEIDSQANLEIPCVL